MCQNKLHPKSFYAKTFGVQFNYDTAYCCGYDDRVIGEGKEGKEFKELKELTLSGVLQVLLVLLVLPVLPVLQVLPGLPGGR